VDKVVASPQEALADIKDGATVAIAGFSVGHRFATSLIIALRDKGTKNLTLVCNSLGDAGATRGQILCESKQVKKIMVAFSWRPGLPTAAEEQITAGTLEVELVPQGILVERCRAGGAGVPAFYSPTSVGTALTEGKELREFNGKTYVLEHAIQVDYALLRGYRADRHGNVQFRGGSQNFNPSFAKAARMAIVEVDEIVEVGGIPPELIDLPGIFVKRVVKSTQNEGQVKRRPERRPSDKPRLYNGKPALTRAGIAKRAAGLVRDQSYVNLGTGIPTMVSNHLQGRDVILHAENGVLGYGRMVENENEIDPDVYNAAGQFVTLTPGASFFDSVTSFEMARGGFIDTVILAYEVDQDGNLANWSTSDAKRGGIGGAMDLLSGKADIIIVMEHTNSSGGAKLRKQCTYPLTGARCVSYVVTDLALLRWDGKRFVLEEVAPGFTAQEVVALTEMEVTLAPKVGTMA
jgi:3-oxoacid CoA-transferase